MKLIILQLIAASMLFAGCWKRPTEQPQGESKRTAEMVEDVRVYVDRLTGCHYVSNDETSGLQPRLMPDGKQICRAQDVRDPVNRALFYKQ